MIQNDRLLKALRREPVDRAPIWVMRQAGRYLPEYRATRQKAGSFMALCQNPELACEVTLQPIERYGLDAAILFSDILTIPDAMGLGLQFVEGEGPQFAHPVRSQADIRALSVPDPNEALRYVMDAVSLIKKSLNNSIPLIGFAGSPWTLATYMVEGQASKQFHHIKHLCYQYPQLMQMLLDTLTQAVSQYLLAQIESGVDALMVFDSWGGILPTTAYLTYSLQPMQRIVQDIKAKHPNMPVILFTKGGSAWLEHIAATGCDGVGVDWILPMSQVRERIGGQVAIQGNLDPAVLLCDEATIIAETQALLDDFGNHPGHIFNLGHGITPDVKPEAMAALVETVKSSVNDNRFFAVDQSN